MIESGWVTMTKCTAASMIHHAGTRLGMTAAYPAATVTACALQQRPSGG